MIRGWRTFTVCFTCCLCFVLTGCGSDRLNLEDASVPLAIGLDVEDEKLHYYISAPVFSKDIKKKSREAEGMAQGLRQSRSQQDAHFPGSVAGRNYQVMVIGRQMLQYPGWFKMLDVTFRDPRNTITDRIIAVDGSASEIIHYNSKDMPPIASFLRGLVDSGSARSETVKTTTQDFHRQLHDRSMTPAISEVKIENGKVLLKGTALLSQSGQYKTSLTYQETTLLDVLRGDAKPGVSLTYAIPGMTKTGPFDTDLLSFSLGSINSKIKSSYEGGKFHFKVKVKSIVTLTENLFEFDVMNRHRELEKEVNEQMKTGIEKLIKKCQKKKVDPVGFGQYARAYQYNQYKAVQNEWAEAFSEAEVDVSVSLRIGGMGQIR